jgi:hypothetical protein
MSNAPTVSELLSAVQRLKKTDFEDFYAKIQSLHREAGVSDPGTQERRLLEKINSELPRKAQVRWHLLLACRDEGKLSMADKIELADLTELVEAWEAKRLKWLTQLADLRKMTLPEVVKYYQIRPRSNA